MELIRDEKLSIGFNKELKSVLNCELKVSDILRVIKNKEQIDENQYKKSREVGSPPNN